MRSVKKNKQTLLLIGLGELGARLLDILARTPNLGWRIVVASRTPEQAQRRVNAALFAASYADQFPEIEFRAVNLENRDATASLISAEAPAIVVNTASRSPWWARGLLPSHIRDRLERVGAGPGLWAAGHLGLFRHLLAAMREAACSAPIVNAAYPDVLHPALARVAPGPLIGIGNIDLLIPPIRYIVAGIHGLSPRNVTPFVIAHNFHSSRILSGHDLGGRNPLVKILVNGSDVTPELDLLDLWRRIPVATPIPLGAASSAFAVGSLARTVFGVLADARIMSHSPGPEGLPGGYPVEISRAGARVAVPAEIPLQQAIEVNLAGQRGEGIEEIAEDGSLTLTDIAAEVLHDIFDMQARVITPPEAEAFAGELASRFRSLASRYGIYPSDLRRSA